MSRASGRWTSWVGEIEVFGKRPHARLYASQGVTQADLKPEWAARLQQDSAA
jgi:hypothetical protein